VFFAAGSALIIDHARADAKKNLRSNGKSRCESAAAFCVVDFLTDLLWSM